MDARTPPGDNVRAWHQGSPANLGQPPGRVTPDFYHRTSSWCLRSGARLHVRRSCQQLYWGRGLDRGWLGGRGLWSYRSLGAPAGECIHQCPYGWVVTEVILVDPTAAQPGFVRARGILPRKLVDDHLLHHLGHRLGIGLSGILSHSKELVHLALGLRSGVGNPRVELTRSSGGGEITVVQDLLSEPG